MSGFNIAIIVVFASIGLIALALGLLARAYSPGALVTGMAALLALTTASTWIAMAWPEAQSTIADAPAADKPINAITSGDSQALLEREKREGDQARRELASAKQKAAFLETEAARLTADRDAERARSNQAERDAVTARTKAAEFEKKVADLEAIINGANTATATRLPAIASANGSKSLRGKLNIPLNTPFYSSKRLTEPQLVAGLKGSWYVMRLKRGDGPMVFADRKFEIPDAVQEIENSTRAFQSEVMAPLAAAGVRTQVFLRGGADDRRVAGAADAVASRELMILPRLTDGTYVPAPARRSPAKTLTNSDLPNLRADWLRQRIARILQTNIGLLENPPARGGERTVELLLFVAW